MSDTILSLRNEGDINLVVGDTGDINLTITGSDVSTFLQLTDVPNSYSGQSGKVPTVNSGETALEFTTRSVSWGNIDGTLSNQLDLQTALDLKNNITDFDIHVSDTTTHGTTGDIVGISDTQTLSNKKLEDLSTRLMDNLDNTKLAGFELVNLSTGTTRILTLQNKDIVIADNADVTAHTSASTIHFIEGDIDHVNIQNVGTNTHDNIDTHIADTANPHATDIENLGSGTLAELNSAISNATLDDSSSTRTPSAHASAHQNGGGDEVSVSDLSGELADAQKITIRKNTGANVGTRARLNFIEGANTTITTVDDGAGDEVDITIASTAGGASPLTTKGDIYTYSTNDDRLPIGGDGTFLKADSAQATGLAWANPGAAPVDSVFSRTGTVVADNNDYTWAQINKATSDIADITTKSHTSLSDIGTNAHSAIDSHISDGTLHFTESSIDHTAIANIGTNTHSAIDSHISSTTEHGATGAVVGTTNVQTLSNKNLIDLNTRLMDNLDNTKLAGFELINLSTGVTRILTLQDKDITIADNADVTSHTSDATIHFTEGSISIPASQISDFDTEVANNSAVSANTSKVSNVSTNLSAGTLTATTIDVNSSDGTNATLVEADTTNAGILGSDKWDEIVANTAKDTNVSTNITIVEAPTNVDIQSSDGTNDTIAAMNGTNAGVMTTTNFDEHVVNTAHALDNTQAHSDYLINSEADVGVGLTLTGDNSSADTAYVPMVLYNTDATPPTASTVPIGTIYVQYTP